MIRTSRRVVALAIAAAVAIAPVISGCGAGSEPQSAAPTQLTEGVNLSLPQGAKVAQLDIRNMFVLGPANGAKVAAGSAVPLYATLINQVQGRPDRLVGISSPAFAQAKIKDGGVPIPAAQPSGVGSAVSLGGSAGQPPVVALQGLSQELLGGEFLKLRLQFQQAGSIEATVPVVVHHGEYASYAPVPTQAPSPSGSPSPGAPNPGSTISPTPGGTPGSASPSAHS